ncbi:FAS1-like dehydratase domain-containing protein [Sulfobacillus harzensis]|uniref:MaoC family dehydratase n=1 Tax=Sulfobacillus harzensis TaxID=2729629 RepID=A0A7Y0L5A4_9FIRM|nr:MaoC family dehydratase N-terminal domain-containing protein [Sulfobacillus harzensis]NMP23308.1 MaoC family dehydratase [Sulfobacillus harzensis]
MWDYDPGRIGERSAPALHEIEKGAIRRFAEALGETNPVYFDEKAAQRAGYRSLVVPPTFYGTLGRNPIPGLQMPRAGVIHGEQEFVYGKAASAGDRIQVTGWLADVRKVQGSRGAMTLLTIMAEGVHEDGAMAFQSRSVLIISEGVE